MLKPIQANQTIKGKIFEGYIIDKPDPDNLNRYAVYIPELMAPADYGAKYVFCKNVIGSYTNHRDPISKIHFSHGSYEPLSPGTRVLVVFTRETMENSGYIIAVNSTIKSDNHDRDNYTLVFKTKNGARMYIDENQDIINIMQRDGKSNIVMTPDDIILQINDEIGEDYALNTAIKIQRGNIEFIIGDNVYSLTQNGFNMAMGEENNKTFIQMSQGGIQISADKYINIVTEGKLSLNGSKSFLTGYDECHVFSNDLRLTGSQKAQLSGSTVAVWGWLDAHVKGLHVGIDGYMMSSFNSLFSNTLTLVANNTYSPLYNISSLVNTQTSTIIARASTMEAVDGMILTGIGVGASTASSVGASLSSVMLGLELALMSINTAMLFNDPVGGMAAVNYILTGTIAGTANPASDLVTTVLSTLNRDVNDPVSTLNKKIKLNEENSSKYIYPDDVVSFRI